MAAGTGLGRSPASLGFAAPTGITEMITDPGKVILIVSMFIGRLGTLSIIFAFARKILTTNYAYPEEHIMVG